MNNSQKMKATSYRQDTTYRKTVTQDQSDLDLDTYRKQITHKIGQQQKKQKMMQMKQRHLASEIVGKTYSYQNQKNNSTSQLLVSGQKSQVQYSFKNSDITLKQTNTSVQMKNTIIESFRTIVAQEQEGLQEVTKKQLGDNLQKQLNQITEEMGYESYLIEDNANDIIKFASETYDVKQTELALQLLVLKHPEYVVNQIQSGNKLGNVVLPYVFKFFAARDVKFDDRYKNIEHFMKVCPNYNDPFVGVFRLRNFIAQQFRYLKEYVHQATLHQANRATVRLQHKMQQQIDAETKIVFNGVFPSSKQLRAINSITINIKRRYSKMFLSIERSIDENRHLMNRILNMDRVFKMDMTGYIEQDEYRRFLRSLESRDKLSIQHVLKTMVGYDNMLIGKKIRNKMQQLTASGRNSRFRVNVNKNGTSNNKVVRQRDRYRQNNDPSDKKIDDDKDVDGKKIQNDRAKKQTEKKAAHLNNDGKLCYYKRRGSKLGYIDVDFDQYPPECCSIIALYAACQYKPKEDMEPLSFSDIETYVRYEVTRNRTIILENCLKLYPNQYELLKSMTSGSQAVNQWMDYKRMNGAVMQCICLGLLIPFCVYTIPKGLDNQRDSYNYCPNFQGIVLQDFSRKYENHYVFYNDGYNHNCVPNSHFSRATRLVGQDGNWDDLAGHFDYFAPSFNEIETQSEYTDSYSVVEQIPKEKNKKNGKNDSNQMIKVKYVKPDNEYIHELPKEKYNKDTPISLVGNIATQVLPTVDVDAPQAQQQHSPFKCCVVAEPIVSLETIVVPHDIDQELSMIQIPLLNAGPLLEPEIINNSSFNTNPTVLQGPHNEQQQLGYDEGETRIVNVNFFAHHNQVMYGVGINEFVEVTQIINNVNALGNAVNITHRNPGQNNLADNSQSNSIPDPLPEDLHVSGTSVDISLWHPTISNSGTADRSQSNESLNQVMEQAVMAQRNNTPDESSYQDSLQEVLSHNHSIDYDNNFYFRLPQNIEHPFDLTREQMVLPSANPMLDNAIKLLMQPIDGRNPIWIQEFIVPRRGSIYVFLAVPDVTATYYFDHSDTRQMVSVRLPGQTSPGSAECHHVSMRICSPDIYSTFQRKINWDSLCASKRFVSADNNIVFERQRYIVGFNMSVVQVEVREAIANETAAPWGEIVQDNQQVLYDVGCNFCKDVVMVQDYLGFGHKCKYAAQNHYQFGPGRVGRFSDKLTNQQLVLRHDCDYLSTQLIPTQQNAKGTVIAKRNEFTNAMSWNLLQTEGVQKNNRGVSITWENQQRIIVAKMVVDLRTLENTKLLKAINVADLENKTDPPEIEVYVPNLHLFKISATALVLYSMRVERQGGWQYPQLIMAFMLLLIKTCEIRYNLFSTLYKTTHRKGVVLCLDVIQGSGKRKRPSSKSGWLTYLVVGCGAILVYKQRAIVKNLVAKIIGSTWRSLSTIVTGQSTGKWANLNLRCILEDWEIQARMFMRTVVSSLCTSENADFIRLTRQQAMALAIERATLLKDKAVNLAEIHGLGKRQQQQEMADYRRGLQDTIINGNLFKPAPRSNFKQVNMDISNKRPDQHEFDSLPIPNSFERDQMNSYALQILSSKSNDICDFHQLHVQSVRFEQDVLQPGRTCMNVTTTYFPRDNRMIVDLLRNCSCNKDNLYQTVRWQKTGPLMYIDGNKVESYTFGNCIVNLFYAAHGRHGGGRSSPDPQTLRDFRDFAHRRVDELSEIARKHLNTHNWDAEKFLTKFDADKQEKYKRGLRKLYRTLKLGSVMTLHTKQKEVSLFDRGYKTSGRPRAIWEQDETLNFVSGFFNQILIDCFKTAHTGMIHGLNSSDLQDYFQKGNGLIPTNHWFIAGDTSGHDSAQYSSLIESCDNRMIRNLFMDIIYKMEQGGMALNDPIKEQLLYNLTMLKTPYILRHKGRIIEKGKVNGTVFSGHATRTTFGNTLRVLMYLEYAMHGCGYEHRVFASGDDALVTTDKSNVADVTRRLYERVYIREQGQGALGQVCKKLSVDPLYIDFLSKAGVASWLGISFARKPYRALFSGGYMKTNKITVQDHKNARAYSWFSWASILKPFCKVNFREGSFKNKDAFNTYQDQMHVNHRITDPVAIQQLYQHELRNAYYKFITADPNRDMYLDEIVGCGIMAPYLQSTNFENTGLIVGCMPHTKLYPGVALLSDTLALNAPSPKLLSEFASSGFVNLVPTTLSLSEKDYESKFFRLFMQKEHESEYIRYMVDRPDSGIPLDNIKKNNNASQKRVTKNQQKNQRPNKVVKKTKTVMPKKKQNRTSQLMRVPPYVKSVLSPHDCAPIKGPSSFARNTSIAEKITTQKVAADTAGTIYVIAFPQNFTHNGTAPSAGLFNWIVLNNTTMGTSSVASTYTSFMSNTGSVDTGTGIWTSARLLRAGFRFYPLANDNVRAGIYTCGSDFGRQWSSGTALSTIVNAFPTQSQILQLSNSYEVSLVADQFSGKLEFNWLPLDDLDMQFMAASSGNTNLAQDMLYRNPMYIRFDGLASGETWQFEYKETFEYIPTMVQKPFAPADAQITRSADVNVLRDIIETHNPDSIQNGSLGSRLRSHASNVIDSAVRAVTRFAQMSNFNRGHYAHQHNLAIEL